MQSHKLFQTSVPVGVKDSGSSNLCGAEKHREYKLVFSRNRFVQKKKYAQLPDAKVDAQLGSTLDPNHEDRENVIGRHLSFLSLLKAETADTWGKLVCSPGVRSF